MLLWIEFVICTLVIVAATFLPKIGEGIAEITGLWQTICGK
jgi:hypothetical protein